MAIVAMSEPYADSPKHYELTNPATLKDTRTVIVIKHRDNQTELLRAAQDDKVKYQDAIGFIEPAIAEAQATQDLVVGSESQPFSILGILGGLGVGGAIGRALKRPGDKSPEEFELEIKNRTLTINGSDLA